VDPIVRRFLLVLAGGAALIALSVILA